MLVSYNSNSPVLSHVLVRHNGVVSDEHNALVLVHALLRALSDTFSCPHFSVCVLFDVAVNSSSPYSVISSLSLSLCSRSLSLSLSLSLPPFSLSLSPSLSVTRSPLSASPVSFSFCSLLFLSLFRLVVINLLSVGICIKKTVV